jgi:hypothetical protein
MTAVLAVKFFMPPGNRTPPCLSTVVAWSASFLYILCQRFSSGGRLIPPPDKSRQIMPKIVTTWTMIQSPAWSIPINPAGLESHAKHWKRRCSPARAAEGEKDLACRLQNPHSTLGHIRRPKWKKEVRARCPKAAAAGHPQKNLKEEQRCWKNSE